MSCTYFLFYSWIWNSKKKKIDGITSPLEGLKPPLCLHSSKLSHAARSMARVCVLSSGGSIWAGNLHGACALYWRRCSISDLKTNFPEYNWWWFVVTTQTDWVPDVQRCWGGQNLPTSGSTKMGDLKKKKSKERKAVWKKRVSRQVLCFCCIKQMKGWKFYFFIMQSERCADVIFAPTRNTKSEAQ